MSKVEILRGFVTERLTAAAQEIFAVVERTVAGYEEEASGFQQEIDRQRRQLDVLLQPRVRLTRADELQLLPVCEEEEEAGGAELPREEEQHRQQPGDTRHLSLLCQVEEEEGEGEEEESPERPTTSRESRESLEDPDYQTASRSLPPGALPERRKPKPPHIREAQRHLDLRVCMLQDCHTDVLSNSVFQSCPVQEVKCPRGLQEADFLDLLRSSFPQLSGNNKPFDVFTTDRTRRLQPLKLKMLTPEEIHKSIKSSGAGKSALYIRVKAGEERQTREEELHPPQLKDDATEDSPSSSATITSDHSSCSNPIQRVESDREDVLPSNSTSQQQRMETEEDRGVSEPTTDVLALSSAHSAAKSQWDANSEDQKHRAEASDGDDDWKCSKSEEDLKESDLEPHSPKTPRKRQVKRSGAKSSPKTGNSNSTLACKVCGALQRSTGILIKHAWSHGDHPGRLCGVCGEHVESAEALRSHLQSHQKTHDCPICGKSYLTIGGLNGHVAAHTGVKPHKCDICHKAFGLKEQVKAHRRIHTGEKSFRCSVCGKSLCDLRSLSRHRLTHTGEKRYGCQVCGKRFALPGTLKVHEKTHVARDRPYLCDMCCKMFITSRQLEIHMRTHTKERPYRCSECGKGFSTKGALTIHTRIHTGEAPYRCPKCDWSFKRKTHLTNHLRVHSGQKPFVCGVCGKACSRPEHLTVHMRTHSGERPYQCTVCDKAFTQSHCLKTHMKSHQLGETAP